MIQDLRLGMRTLRKQPGFTTIAVVTLALGIGATAAVFSLIQGVLLTPPPYRDPGRLVLIQSARSDGQKTDRPQAWPSAQWEEWQQQARSLDGVAAYAWSFNYLIRGDGSESMEGMYVTGDYFRVTGLQPVMGRSFTAAEVAARRTEVMLLGYDCWQRKFNGDPHILGKTVRISRFDAPVTIVGVMPPGVRFLPSPENAKEPNYNVNAQVDFWFPATPDPARRKNPNWDVVGRLKAGVTMRQAQDDLAVLAAREAQAEHDFAGVTPHVESLMAEFNGDSSRVLLPLLGAAGLVLLIACGNVAALLLVRGLQRQQEYAVRSALGIGRVALFRHVSTESLILALTGGALGVALAFGAVRVFKAIGGHAVQRLDAVHTGWPVLACGLGAALVAALLAGVLPAARASRLDPVSVLKSAGPKSSAGRGERRLLRSVTMVQTALTLCLLVGATLLIRTMINLAEVRTGYDTTHVLAMSVTAVQGNWLDFHRRALERVSALPGVQYAAFAWGVPLTGNNWPVPVEVEGQPPAVKPSDVLPLPLRAITPDYFNVLGLHMVEGRGLRASDDDKAPNVAVINQALAARYFPDGNAIGKKLWIGGRNNSNKGTEIVGVVGNGRTDDLTEPAGPEIYLSLWQARAFSKHLVVRTASDPRTVMAAVERELYAVDPTASVEGMKTLGQIRDDSLASRNFAMQLLVGFSGVGSVLTLVGIYGVLSLSVASRRREIAIRAAVGAGQSDIRNLVFAEGFRLIAGGVAVGAAAAFVLSRVLRTFLFGVEATDPLTLIGVTTLFAAVALLACWTPIRRAAKVDPVEALRYD